MPAADRQIAFAERWLAKAKTDLALAALVLRRGPDMEPWVAAFHAQQSAEKCIKALMIARWIEPPRGHNLRALADALPREIDLGAPMDALATLSKYSSDVRYSGPYEQVREPTWEEAEAAVATARSVFDAATVQIRGE